MELIVLLGQTSSGKSELAVKLAKKLENCWIVGCDSRQIYKNLNLGTGKIEGKWQIQNGLEAFYFRAIPHFLIDYLDPFTCQIPYSVSSYISDFNNLFKNLSLPKYVILTGGSGLYAKTIYNQVDLGVVKDKFLIKYKVFKAELQSLKLVQLQEKLNLFFSEVKLNHSDYNNPRRVVSSILKNTSIKKGWVQSTSYPQFIKTHLFALTGDNLKEKIEARIKIRLQDGLISEVESLLGLGEEKLINLGLEYRLIYLYLKGLMTYSELEEKILGENMAYSKRQLTWLKKEPLVWVDTFEEILKNLN